MGEESEIQKSLVEILKSKIGIKSKPKDIARDEIEIEDNFKEALQKMFTKMQKKVIKSVPKMDLSVFSKIEKADDDDEEAFLLMVQSEGFKEQYPEIWALIEGYMLPSELAKIMYEFMSMGIEFGLSEALSQIRGLEGNISFKLYDQRVSEFLDNYVFKASQKTMNRLVGNVLGEIKKAQEAGESIPQIQERLDTVFTGMKDYETERIARTETIKSSNAGRFEAYVEAGVPKKVWLGRDDGRERDSHQHLNYEIKPLMEKFSNGLMYPGDPDGEASEVINCRCAIGAIYPENEAEYVKKYNDYQKSKEKEWGKKKPKKKKKRKE